MAPTLDTFPRRTQRQRGYGCKANRLMPFEYIGNIRTSEPDKVTLNPNYQLPGLNS